MRYANAFSILEKKISIDSPCYFIADIAANHDGDLGRAKELIWKAKEAGADCVKFQHFKAEKIVSDLGFKSLGQQASHQAAWKKSVFDIYKQYEFNRSWNESLAAVAREAGVHFMTTPYDAEAVEEIDSLVPAYKIGSGDITWHDFLAYVARKNKPMILATGASSMVEVEASVSAVLAVNPNLALLQCNTNYTGSLENFRYVNLRVLNSFALKFPQMILGLSDHTPGHATVLGAIALGARVVEKHFTDDNGRAGPDHAFSMNPHTWREMIDRSRELEHSFGDGIKRVEKNEEETVVIQRRCLRASREIPAGKEISKDDLEVLRPAPRGALLPYEQFQLIGKKLKIAKKFGEAFYPQDIAT